MNVFDKPHMLGLPLEGRSVLTEADR